MHETKVKYEVLIPQIPSVILRDMMHNRLPLLTLFLLSFSLSSVCVLAVIIHFLIALQLTYLNK